MKRLRSIPALGAFFVAGAVAISGCGSAIPGNSVAVMAGNPITTQAFNHWMYVAAKQEAAQAPGQPVIVPNDPPNFARCVAEVRAQIPALKKTPDKTIKADCKQLFTSLSGQVMDFLIKAYWFQADAHKAGVKITDAQVQKALDTAKKGQFSTAAQFQTFLTSSGQTLADVTYRVKVQQIYSKLLAKHPTTVSDAAIAAYYAAHRAQFGTPQSRNMRIVLAKSEAEALKAEALLKHGASWKTIAKKYSIDPTTKNNGGVLTNVTEGQQDQALSSAAFSASKNQILGPIHGQFGWYVLQVTGITPATARTLAQSSTLIKQTLQQQLQTAAENAVTNQAKKDWLAKTKCRPLYSMADCAGYKAPKATTSTPAAPTSAP
jgi:foldase protein PrsA